MPKILLILIFIISPFLIFPQNDSDDIQDEQSQWEFDLTPYIWFSSITGEVSFLNQTVPVDAEFKDILDQLSFGALIHAEAHSGSWTLFTDLIFMKIKEDGNIRDTSQTLNIELDQIVWELGAGYRIIRLEDYLAVDGLFGMRYFGLKPSIDISQQNVLDKSVDFVDPFFGIRFKTLNGKWINSARFDVGGLGIGSEFSWKLNLLIGYQFSDLFSWYLGYQGYDVDYEGDNNFVYDVYTGGFITGFNFHF